MTRVANTGRTRRTVQASDLAEKSLGVGSPVSANKQSGKDKARWSTVDLTGGGAAAGTVKEYDVPHDLGQVPELVNLETFGNPQVAGTVIQMAAEARRENWSHSHVHVNLRLVAGSFDGCTATFRVFGR